MRMSGAINTAPSMESSGAPHPLSNGERIVFASTVPRAMRSAVEDLFFFNPRQPFLREGINAAIAHLGMPEIVESDDRVWIDVSPGKAQCIFACDMSIEPFRAVGVVLYSRHAIDTIGISHLAIDPDYAYGGKNVSLEVAARLVDRVRAIARSIRGITRIQLPYRDGRWLRVGRSQRER